MLAKNKHFGLYIGMTGRKLEEEDLRWLTKRGANMMHTEKKSKARNRPVIQHQDGEVIKMKEAREVFGFKSMVVYESKCKKNVCDVEDAMQAYLHDEFIDPHHQDGTKGLKLGRRFWRHVAMGPKKNAVIGHYKTFVTFSLDIGKHFGEKIKVVE